MYKLSVSISYGAFPVSQSHRKHLSLSLRKENGELFQCYSDGPALYNTQHLHFHPIIPCLPCSRRLIQKNVTPFIEHGRFQERNWKEIARHELETSGPCIAQQTNSIISSASLLATRQTRELLSCTLTSPFQYLRCYTFRSRPVLHTCQPASPYFVQSTRNQLG